MPPIQTSTEALPITAAVFWEVNADFTREPVTIASGAGELAAGTVLGKISASGKYVPSPATGSDGSQTAVAILTGKVDATSGDVVAMAVTDGPALVDPAYLTFASSVNDDAKKQAKLDQLAAVGIKTVKGA